VLCQGVSAALGQRKVCLALSRSCAEAEEQPTTSMSFRLQIVGGPHGLLLQLARECEAGVPLHRLIAQDPMLQRRGTGTWATGPYSYPRTQGSQWSGCIAGQDCQAKRQTEEESASYTAVQLFGLRAVLLQPHLLNH